MRHRQSLVHEVEYDCEQSQVDAQEKFARDTRNFRYAIEVAMFLTQRRLTPAQPFGVLEVIGMID